VIKEAHPQLLTIPPPKLWCKQRSLTEVQQKDGARSLRPDAGCGSSSGIRVGRVC
jgi:hypothetical protein